MWRAGSTNETSKTVAHVTANVHLRSHMIPTENCMKDGAS